MEAYSCCQLQEGIFCWGNLYWTRCVHWAHVVNRDVYDWAQITHADSIRQRFRVQVLSFLFSEVPCNSRSNLISYRLVPMSSLKQVSLTLDGQVVSFVIVPCFDGWRICVLKKMLFSGCGFKCPASRGFFWPSVVGFKVLCSSNPI